MLEVRLILILLCSFASADDFYDGFIEVKLDKTNLKAGETLSGEVLAANFESFAFNASTSCSNLFIRR